MNLKELEILLLENTSNVNLCDIQEFINCYISEEIKEATGKDVILIDKEDFYIDSDVRTLINDFNTYYETLV